MERIANDSERDHWPIMEVLCTYVREHSRDQKESGQDKQRPEGPRADIQTILTVLGRRNVKYETYANHLDLQGANLSGADLSRAFLEKAQLRWAYLIEANLSEAHLSEANLSGAILIMAHDLTQQQIDEAIGNSETNLPHNLHMPESWKGNQSQNRER